MSAVQQDLANGGIDGTRYVTVLEFEFTARINKRRLSSQPLKEKSAGCIFKNPPGLSTGKLIDELGMKGARVGGAVISERHANFIVNRFNGTASDILGLMDVIRERIYQAHGIELEPEVIIWKN